MSHFKHLKGKIRIFIQLTRINLSILLISLIGLSIALSMSSVCLIYLDTNKASVYMSIIEDGDFHDPRLSAFRNKESPLNNYTYSDILAIQENLTHQFEDFHLNTFLTPGLLSPYYMIENKHSSCYAGINFDDSLLEDCIEGSKIPSSMNETIIFCAGLLPDITIGDVFNFTYTHYATEGFIFQTNYTMKIVGISLLDNLQEDSLIKDILPISSDILLLGDINSFFSFLEPIENKVSQAVYQKTGINRSEQIEVTIYFPYSFNKSKMTSNNVIEAITNLKHFLNEKGSFFEANGIGLRNKFYHDYMQIIREKIASFRNGYYLFLLLVTPIFILTILMVKFSLNLATVRKKRSIALCKMRALSNRYILAVLVVEMIIITILGSVAGIGLGIPLFLLIASTTGFLTMNVAGVRPNLIITPLSMQLVFLISFSLTFLTHFQQLLAFSRAPIISLRKKIILKKAQIPRRFHGNIDILLLIQGSLGVVLLSWLMDIALRNSLLFNTIGPLFLLLLLLSPLAFLIGMLLFFHRFYPVIIKIISSFFWNKDRKQLAIATRNLSINKKLSEQTALVIAIALSFLMILSSLPVSIYNYQLESNHYSIGCDMQMYIWNVNQKEELITQLTSIQGLDVTQIGQVRPMHRYHGIEENFSQVAHWQDSYDDSSLDELVSSVFSSNADFPVIVSSNFASQKKLSLGECFIGLEEINCTIVGISDYWPGTHRLVIDSYFVIASLTKLTNTSVSEHIDYYIMCKFLPGYNPSSLQNQVVDIINHFDVAEIEIAREYLNELNVNNPSNLYIWIITNLNFFASLGVVLCSVALFSFGRLISNTAEIQLSRALGMKSRQLFLLMVLEPLILLFICGIPGSIMGLGLLISFVLLVKPFLTLNPPFILALNYPLIIFIYCLILVITMAFAALSSFVARRINIAKIMERD